MSITILYYKAYEENINSSQIEQWLAPLPQNKADQIRQLRNRADQFLSAAGLTLLRYAISNFTDIDFNPAKLEFPAQQKPSYPANVDFNISHSGNIVCCAISQQDTVGIDVEVRRTVTPTLMDKILGNHHQTSEAFFDIWTKNEAIIKAACRGSVFNMKDISLTDTGGYYHEKFWYCYRIEIEKDYTCHLATGAADADIKIQQITELSL